MSQKPAKKSSKLRLVIVSITVLAIIALIVAGIVVAIRNSNIPEFDDGSELGVVSLAIKDSETSEWYAKIEDESIASVYDKTNSENESHYIFKGKKPGCTKVTFKYGSFTDGRTLEEHTYRIEVNKDLQIKVVEE